MPKVPDSSPALSLSSLRVLAALSTGAAMTSRQLAGRADGDPAALEARGLVKRIELDIDGIKERCWQITPAGKAKLAKSGGVSAKRQTVADGLTSGDKARKISTLVPWFGGARLTGAEVGRSLEGCKFVTVPFCGGLSELPHISAPTILCNDLHRHVVNLCRVLADPVLGPQLSRRLRRKPFHPETLDAAQALASKGVLTDPDLDAAEAYFVCAWMGRSGRSGTKGELKGGLALRWGATGGDSALRFSNAVMGLRGWRRILARCSFTCMDWRHFLAKVKDKSGHAVYADPPWPQTGGSYLHGGDFDHEGLAEVLGGYESARIVVRNLDCDLVRRLYPEPAWRWRTFAGRNQGNNEVDEALICNER